MAKATVIRDGNDADAIVPDGVNGNGPFIMLKVSSGILDGDSKCHSEHSQDPVRCERCERRFERGLRARGWFLFFVHYYTTPSLRCPSLLSVLELHVVQPLV